MNGSTDPRRLGGDIAGPGGPTDMHQVVFDTTNSVLLGNVEMALGHGEQAGDFFAVLLEGRINRSKDHAKVLYVLDGDGLAAIVTEALSLAHRAEQAGAQNLVAEYNIALQRRTRQLRSEGLL